MTGSAPMQDMMHDEPSAQTDPGKGSARGILLFLGGAALLVTAILSAANLVLAEPNQDEGWYLYAMRLVSEGKQPYVDFASTQGPVMPYAYLPAGVLVDRWGVAGGRLFTSLIGLACCLATAGLAARLAPRGRKGAAALAAFMLVGVNVYQSCFFTIVKTYALTALFMVLGFIALTYRQGRRSFFPHALAGVLLALAAGTRLSAVAALPVVFVGLAWKAMGRASAPGVDKETPRRSAGIQLVSFTVGACATLALLFVPFWLKAPEALRFALWEYHAGREAGRALSFFAYKAGFLSRFVQDYFVAVTLFVIVGVARFALRGEANRDTERAGMGFLWWTFVLVSAVHFSAPFPYDDYQVIVYPVLAAALAVEGICILDGMKPRVVAGILAGLLLVCSAAAFSSPVNQGWFIGQRDRIWWPMKKRIPLAVLREAGSYVRSISKPGDLLLTQDTYLAIEAGRNVPPGLELGPFSYYPALSRERAARLHVMNPDLMRDLLENCSAPVAAFSGFGLAIGSPGVVELAKEEQAALKEIVDRRFQVDRVIPSFGHAETPLTLYRSR